MQSSSKKRKKRKNKIKGGKDLKLNLRKSESCGIVESTKKACAWTGSFTPTSTGTTSGQSICFSTFPTHTHTKLLSIKSSFTIMKPTSRADVPSFWVHTLLGPLCLDIPQS